MTDKGVDFKMKPIIGITAEVEKEHNSVLHHNYVKAVKEAGGLPIILPTGIEKDIEQLAHMVDGVIFSGGGDIDPELFDEDPHPRLGEVTPCRDLFELALVKELLKLDKPIFGICRGLQILNVAFGGNVFQDMHTVSAKPLIQHNQKAPASYASHYIEVVEGSLLEKITKTDRFKVNSFHHQSAKYVPKSLKISASTNDGVIEAIESPTRKFVLGVQWHPEATAACGDIFSQRIFRKFVESSKKG